jgi:very-short-patch-repair endonuclease
MPFYEDEQVAPFRLYDDERVRPFRIYDDEVADGDFLSLADVLPMLAIRFGDDGTSSQEEFKKAVLTVKPESFSASAEYAWERGQSKCESPIEKMLLPWLICQRYQFFDYNPTVLFPGETDQYVPGTLAVIPQLPIGRYRVDFALAASLGGGPIKFVVVECDGKEFHDGVENVKRDVNRDVSILSNKRVLDVFRLDGREILSNPQLAGHRVAKAVLEAWRKK